LAVSEQRPNFLFVCDHGIRGGQLDRAALWPWLPERASWWAAEGIDEESISLYPMTAERRGWDPKWLTPAQTGPDEPDLRREAAEIKCPEPRCSQRAYRCDDEKLQTLLTKIATDDKFRTVFAVRADESQIVMTLHALHAARDTAKRCYRLQV
jgi:hypothetical protein